jgi:hypothetical protein
MPKKRKSRWDRKLPWKHPIWQTDPDPPDWLEAYWGDIAYARKLSYRKPSRQARMVNRTVYEAALGEGFDDRAYEMEMLRRTQ